MPSIENGLAFWTKWWIKNLDIDVEAEDVAEGLHDGAVWTGFNFIKQIKLKKAWTFDIFN